MKTGRLLEELWGVFHIELVNGCPNNCEACASQQSLYLMDDGTMNWTIHQMKKFKDKFSNTRLAVKLFGTGESVLHPGLGRFAAQVRRELNPDFLTLSTNIKTLKNFKPDLPTEVANVVVSRLDDTFDDEVIARYGNNRLGILVPNASDATVDRIVEIDAIWPTPSIQLVRMYDLEIPSKGRDAFVRRKLSFSSVPSFKDKLIAKLLDRGLFIVDEFQPAAWNIRVTLRHDRTIDACIMRRATIPFDFGSDDFYAKYFYERKKMCADCPRREGSFNLSLTKTMRGAEEREAMLKNKHLPAEILERR